MPKPIVLVFSAMLAVPVSATVMTIWEPSSIIWSSNVRKHCEVDTACTDFSDTDFYCSCFHRGDKWSATVKITARPHVYLSHESFAVHELTHVLDFELMMQRHVESIEVKTFETRAECDAFAGKSRLGFAGVLRDFQRVSTLRRDGRADGAPGRK